MGDAVVFELEVEEGGAGDGDEDGLGGDGRRRRRWKRARRGEDTGTAVWASLRPRAVMSKWRGWGLLGSPDVGADLAGRTG